MNQIFSWISVVSLVLSLLSILLYCFGKSRKDSHKLEISSYPLPYVIGALLIIVIVCMSAIFTVLIMVKPISDSSDKLVNMQSVTLTITAAAISLIAIISSLKNYDYEKKGKEIEKELKNLYEIKKEQEEDYEELIEDFSDNVKILFDSNSKDNVYLTVRIKMYEKALNEAIEKAQSYKTGGEKRKYYREIKKCINIGIALIDALSQRKLTASAKNREIINYQIIGIVDDIVYEGMDVSEKNNLLIKKAIANYENAIVHISNENETGKEEITTAYDIYKGLLDNDDVPRVLDKHLKGNLGLCLYWKFRAYGNKRFLTESIKYYEECNPIEENNALIMNSLAVSKQNMARLEENLDVKIDLFYKVIDDYRQSLRIDAKREITWLNIASVYADISHALIGIDIRKRNNDFIIKEIADDSFRRTIEDSYKQGIGFIDKAMAINPGFVNNYYVYADLCCCCAQVMESKIKQERLLKDAYKHLEHGLFFNNQAKEIKNVVYFFKKTILFLNLEQQFPNVDLSEDDSKLNKT